MTASLPRLRNKLDLAIAASLAAMVTMNVLVLAQQLQAAAAFAAASTAVLQA